MAYFLRYTETPNADMERGVSYHLSSVEREGCEWNEYFKRYAEELPGLCAFPLEAETLEEAIEEAESREFDSIFNRNEDSWCIIEGKYIGDCPEGDVIRAHKLLHIVKNKYYAE